MSSLGFQGRKRRQRKQQRPMPTTRAVDVVLTNGVKPIITSPDKPTTPIMSREEQWHHMIDQEDQWGALQKILVTAIIKNIHHLTEQQTKAFANTFVAYTTDYEDQFKNFTMIPPDKDPEAPPENDVMPLEPDSE